MPQSYFGLDGQYIVHETIGSGGFGKVKKASHIATGEKVAIKIMEKKRLGGDLPRVKLEVEALKELHHPNICELYEVIETKDRIFLVLEYCSGGELFDYIVERARLEEKEARVFFRQILAAVHYIHTMGYAHRDLKPENLLIGENRQLKVIDFGLCAKPQGGIGDPLQTFCGSPAYAAPELIQEENYFGDKADIWSMGVLLFALLCGYLPFDDENMQILYQKIQHGKFDCPTWLSYWSKDLLRKMLEVNPTKRIGIYGVLMHSWVCEEPRDKFLSRGTSYKDAKLDEDCLNFMIAGFGYERSSLERKLSQWQYDYLTSTYLLLLLKKRKGRLMHVLASCLSPLKSVNRNPQSEVGCSLESGLNDFQLLNLGSPPKKDDAKTQQKFKTSDKENFAHPQLPKSSRKNKNKTDATQIRGRPATPGRVGQGHLLPPTPSPSNKRRSKSCDRKDDVLRTPDRSNHFNFLTPTKAKHVLGSLEKGVDRFIGYLTPRKKADLGLHRPRKIKGKGLYNVSVIRDCRNADQVMTMLKNALESRGIPCKQDGYSLRNKRRDENGKVVLNFELEVCLLAPEELVCVSRKRLKGDAWLYKRVVEEILHVINTNQASSS